MFCKNLNIKINLHNTGRKEENNLTCLVRKNENYIIGIVWAGLYLAKHWDYSLELAVDLSLSISTL